MTVISAACAGGRAWMASDSDMVDGNGRPWPAQKIISITVGAVDVALLGHTGPASVQHRVRQRLAVEGLASGSADQDDDVWADALAVRLETWAREDPSLAEDGEIDATWLLARAGRLWRLRPGCATALDGYNAIGWGGDLALGVLHGRLEGVTDPSPATVRDAVVAGVRAALRFDESCRGDVVLRDRRPTSGPAHERPRS